MLIIPSRYTDKRGFFSETYNKSTLLSIGIDVEFVQDNHSVSYQLNTLRGMHFQKPPYSQSKLVRCGKGEIYDVVVDLRVESPTYKRWTSYLLSFENGHQLYIPSGFAHGFLTLHKDCEIIYKCTKFYKPESEGYLNWNDPEININWPLKTPPFLNKKDSEAPF